MISCDIPPGDEPGDERMPSQRSGCDRLRGEVAAVLIVTAVEGCGPGGAPVQYPSRV